MHKPPFLTFRLYVVLLLFLGTIKSVHAQFGVNVGLTVGRANTWQSVIDQYVTFRKSNILESGVTAGLDYTLPSKGGSLIIQPNIQFTHFVNRAISNHNLFDNNPALHLNLFNMSFQLNVNKYLITYAKYRSVSQREDRRGIYIQVSPALDHYRFKVRYYAWDESGNFIGTDQISSVKVGYSIGARLGFDATWKGRVLTQPYFGIRYRSNVEWEDLTEVVSRNQNSGNFNSSALFQYTVGLRIGLDVEKD